MGAEERFDYEQQQKQDEESRTLRAIAVLLMASTRALTQAELSFLASELGLSDRWRHYSHKIYRNAA